MNCVICNKECTGKTCSGACRAKLSRRTAKQEESARARLKDLPAHALYQLINRYEADTWAGSAEYTELMHRLKTLTLEQLKDQGYYVPVWKYKECA